jgi:hypothetical protein
MNVRNYTSSVPAHTSQANIERLLVDVGAMHISRWYDDKKRVVGFSFRLIHEERPLDFKLPSNIEQCERLMRQGISRPRPGTLERIGQQAERTAWKLLHDWVSVQVSMILMGQVKTTEVFLPYWYDSAAGKTLFQVLEDRGFKQLPGAGETTARKGQA